MRSGSLCCSLALHPVPNAELFGIVGSSQSPHLKPRRAPPQYWRYVAAGDTVGALSLAAAGVKRNPRGPYAMLQWCVRPFMRPALLRREPTSAAQCTSHARTHGCCGAQRSRGQPKADFSQGRVAGEVAQVRRAVCV